MTAARRNAQPWLVTGAGFAVALVLAVALDVRLGPANTFAAAIVAAIAGAALMLAGHLGAGDRPVPTTGPTPHPTRHRPDNPGDRRPTDAEESDVTDVVLFGARAADESASTTQRFTWAHLVGDEWRPGAQCPTCAHTDVEGTDTCPRCGHRTTQTRQLSIMTSGPFLDAIAEIPDPGR